MMTKPAKKLFCKELTSYFKTPIGYVFLVIFLFGIGYLTFEPGRGSFFIMRQASLTPFFQYMPWMFVFLIPAVSMKLWAEERRSGTIELLLTMPINVSQAVIMKFLASWAFIGIALLGTLPMVFTTLYLGQPDLGVIFLGYMGSFFMAGTLLAISGFFSALTKNQVVSFILSLVVCFAFIMAGSPPVLNFVSTVLPSYFIDLLESVSILNHFEMMERGVLSLSQFWFFVVMITCWIYASIILLEENKAV